MRGGYFRPGGGVILDRSKSNGCVRVRYMYHIFEILVEIV